MMRQAEQANETIQLTSRPATGKGAARQQRKAGKIPCVVYGPNMQGQCASLDPKTFIPLRLRLGESHIYSIVVDGKTAQKVLIKEVQRDPISRSLLHVDMYALDMSKPIRVDVPIVLEGKPAGLINGGLLTQILRRTEVQCLPDAIPERLVADVSALQVGQSFHVNQLQLPDGVKSMAHGDDPVAALVAPDAGATTAAEAATPAAADAAAAKPAAKPAAKK